MKRAHMLDGSVGRNIDKFSPGEGQERPRAVDGFRPPRLQELRPARQDHRGMCYRVLEKMGKTNNPLFELSLKLEEIALKTTILCAQAVSERGFLFGHHLQRALISPLHVHRDFAMRDRGLVRIGRRLVSDPNMRIGRPASSIPGPRRGITCR